MTTFNRGDIVRAKCRLMFGKLVVPKGTKIHIQGIERFFDIAPAGTDDLFVHEAAYEGRVMLDDKSHLCYPIWPDDVEEVT